MKKIFLFILWFAPAFLIAQEATTMRPPTVEPIVQLAETIKKEELKRHLSVLSSDEFEGRETGTDGQKKAADYIAKHFEGLDLPRIGDDNSYFQKISFISEYWTNIKLEVNGDEVKHLLEFYAYPSTNARRDEPSVFNEIVFLGYGIDSEAYSDYEDVDVEGKAIMIYDGEPLDKNGVSYITGNEEPSDWSSNWRKKLEAAKDNGVSTVFIIDTNFKENVEQARRFIRNTGMSLGHSENAEENYANNVQISSTVARKILGKKFKKVVRARKKIKRKGKPKSVSIETDISLMQKKRVRQLLGENVLGYVEGTDVVLKDEVLIVTAHYDHLGKRGDDIYNGADDNGSGTSSVLELAEAFAEAKKKGWGPRRSVLFMLVSGEEKGLLGSEYYVNRPVFPLENTIANVNVDMVGRVDPKHEGNPNYIYVIGADRLSSELHQINEQANETYTQLELDYTYNEESDPNRYYYRSDHYNFARNGIPAIFYFNGTHEDYHRVSDTIEKINFEKMEKIARLVFYTSWELANRDKRIEVDVKN